MAAFGKLIRFKDSNGEVGRGATRHHKDHVVELTIAGGVDGRARKGLREHH